jgi:hypothetical protein
MPENLSANTSSAAPEPKRRPNAPLWLGFLIAVFAFLSYIPIFARYPSTRDMPWVNFLFFAIALVSLAIGLRRAFALPSIYRGKIAGPILATLSVAALALFCLFTFSLGKHLPASTQAPKVGQKAPDFALSDIKGGTVTLASLLSTPISPSQPTKGVLLIFYRGYW